MSAAFVIVPTILEGVLSGFIASSESDDPRL